MKMQKINEMQINTDSVQFRALISRSVTGKTNGRIYLNITFSDDTGDIDARYWNVKMEDIKDFETGTVVEGVGDIINYNHQKQMKVLQLKKIILSDDEKLKFVVHAPIDKEEMMKELNRYISLIREQTMHDITMSLIEKNKEAYSISPAASHNHHEYASGLLYHTITMLKVAESLIGIYKTLNRDLLYAGIILHDIGKIRELSGPVSPSYTLEGNLLGHISIGARMINEEAGRLGYSNENVVLLEHMILSHHGKKEYGSPVLPQLKEAEILYFIDNIDARMFMMDKALNETEEGNFTARLFALDNRSIYKQKKENEH